jgi:hypothetical protein
MELFGDGSTKVENLIRKVIVILPVITIIIFFLNRDLRTFVNRMSTRGEITYGPFAALSQDMFSYIENNTEPESVIVFMKPRLMNFLTDRQSIRITNDDDLSPGDYLVFYTRDEFLTKFQIDEVVADRLSKQGTLSIEYENQDFIVYRINKD